MLLCFLFVDIIIMLVLLIINNSMISFVMEMFKDLQYEYNRVAVIIQLLGHNTYHHRFTCKCGKILLKFVQV